MHTSHFHPPHAKIATRQARTPGQVRKTLPGVRPARNPREARLRAIWLNAMLWTLQGWLAMFFAGAAIAKLTAPAAHLDILLGWSEWVQMDVVRVLGGIDALLAATMLAPLFGWRFGRPIVVTAAIALLVMELLFFGVHLLRLDLMLASVNLVLIAMTAPVAILRRHLPA